MNWWDLLLRIILFGLCFITILCVLIHLAGKEIKNIIDYIQKGRKLEYSTKPGFICLTVVILLFVFCLIFITFEKAEHIYTRIFNLAPPPISDTFSFSVVAIFATILANLIFLGASISNKNKLD